MHIKIFKDGTCRVSTEKYSVTLYIDGELEIEDGTNVEPCSTTIPIPDWLAEAMRKAFEEEVERYFNQGA